MDPIGAFSQCIAAHGVIGLIVLGAVERFVPIVPSTAFLVAIGIAISGGLWSVPGALAATVAGSLAGCLSLYALARGLGQGGAHRLLGWMERLGAISAHRIDGMRTSLHAHQRLLAFGSQLIPAVRLVSPVIAGSFRTGAMGFALATMAGITVWNGVFIGVGLIATTIAPTASASVLALEVLILLVLVQVSFGLAWRGIFRRAPAGSGPAEHAAERSAWRRGDFT